jgi:hypothetical protein
MAKEALARELEEEEDDSEEEKKQVKPEDESLAPGMQSYIDKAIQFERSKTEKLEEKVKKER